MENLPIKFLQVKVVALAVADEKRAHHFYRDTLGLKPANEGDEVIGYYIGNTILMLKTGGLATPTAELNPRITLETDHVLQTEAAMRARGITISDPVQAYGDNSVGSFLDSEGNKLWFCSPTAVA